MKTTGYELQMEAYLDHLINEERSQSTIKQYRRDICCFFVYLDGEPPTREAALCYKEKLEQAYQPISVNAKLSALNSYFTFIGRRDLRLKLLKIQKKRLLLCGEGVEQGGVSAPGEGDKGKEE